MNSVMHDLNIERAVLSTIIFDSNQYYLLDRALNPEIFYHPFHREVASVIIELQDKDKPVEEYFIKSIMEKRNSFDEMAFLEILSTSPIFDLGRYVERLDAFRIKRRLHEYSLMLQKKLQGDDPEENLFEVAEKELFDIASSVEKAGPSPLPDALDLAMMHIDEMKMRSNGLIGIDTGFSALNAKTSGFAAGDLVIIAARPSMGKTSLALNIALLTASQGNGVVFFSLEMPKEQIALRLLSMHSGVPLEKIRAGHLDTGQEDEVRKSRSTLARLDITVDDDGMVSMREIRMRLRKILMKNPGVKVAMIDYLQLMSASNIKERHLQIAEISRGLKLLARELNIVIIALSQLNRQLETRVDKRPLLSDLRESGSIEQDADLILFVYRDDVYKVQKEKEKEKELRAKGMEYKVNINEQPVSKAEIIIGKQRNGPVGQISLQFHKPTASFRENPVKVIYE